MKTMLTILLCTLCTAGCAQDTMRPDALPTPRLPAPAVDELKRHYLACDRAAMRGLLGAGHAAHCSTVYETLKREAFGGSFEALLAWSRMQGSALP